MRTDPAPAAEGRPPTRTRRAGRWIRYVARSGAGEVRALASSAARVRESGPEREQLIQAMKSAAAAVASWSVAAYLLDSPLAIVAPWVAIVLVQSTIHRSVSKGIAQLGAIAVGAVLAAVAGIVFGHTVLALAVVLPVTLLLAYWRRLGEQGSYAATTALFVLAYDAVSWTSVLDRLIEAVLGAVIGILVNVLVHPPIQLRNGRTWVRSLAHGVHDQLDGMAHGLTTELSYDRVRTWHAHVDDLDQRLDDMRSMMSWSRESLTLNPRRRRNLPTPQELGYERVAGIYDRVIAHVADLTRALVDDATVSQVLIGDGEPRRPPAEVMPYAVFLRETAKCCLVYGERVTAESEPGFAAENLREKVTCAEKALHHYGTRVHDAMDGQQAPVLSTLLLTGHRLLDDLREMESSTGVER